MNGLMKIKRIKIAQDVDTVNFLLGKGYVLIDIAHVKDGLAYVLGSREEHTED